MKKIAVVLTGCGFQDGAEITEAVSSLISLGECGATVQCFAPDMDFDPTNHMTGEPKGEKRSVIPEAARICRGKVKKLSELNANDFDGIVFPGGFGVALLLCDWATKGSNATVQPGVSKIITDFHEQSKPICAMCIAPALIARVLGAKEVNVTIGTYKETATEIEKTGAVHVECAVTDYVTDRENKIVTTPAYMFEVEPFEVFKGVNSAIKEFYEMA